MVYQCAYCCEDLQSRGRFCDRDCERGQRQRLRSEFGLYANCNGCGKQVELSTVPPEDVCCRDCRSAKASEESDEECETCGDKLSRVQANRGAKYCSSGCYGKACRVYADEDGYSRRDVLRQKWRRQGRRRRMRKEAHCEPYSRQEVGRRDGWRCGLCGGKVRRNVAYPHPQFPVVDHIVPLSRGGHDVKKNVQIAHNRCNNVKNDGVFGDGEQLRLIG